MMEEGEGEVEDASKPTTPPPPSAPEEEGQSPPPTETTTEPVPESLTEAEPTPEGEATTEPEAAPETAPEPEPEPVKPSPTQLRENAALFMANQAHMMGSKEPPVYEPGQDLRLDFVYGFISRSFRIKPDKWKAYLQNEEYKSALYDFFDNPETMFMVINFSSEGILMPITNFPPCVKTKSVYMLKKSAVAFPIDEYGNFRDALIVGDLPPQPLEALMTFVEEIIRPVVTSEVNQDKWPETVVADLKQQTQEICSVLYTVQGQLRGKTLLPMPINLDLIEENERRLEQGGPGEVDLQLRTSLETLVIKWSQQINEVLQQDPSKPLKTGQNPSPYVELAFWEERVQDLKTIYSQLNDDKVRKLANILEKTNSTYWPCFKSMFRNVVAALAESQDILAYLKPLRRYLDIVQQTDFEELADHLEPLMHCVCLVWGHSRYYCSPARIIDLLQEICNLLITRARDYITSAPIFQTEPVEGQRRADTTVSTLQLFRELYDANKGELPIYFSQESEAKNWDFLPQLVFSRYDKFLDKMKKIKNFFDTSMEFYNLEVVDIGGNKGKYLKAYVQELHKEFTEFYQTYSEINYDYADPDDNRFDNDYNLFKEKVEHVDKRLSAIVVIGFEASDTPESIYKLITTLGALLERPIVKADFEQQYPLYVSMLDQEMAKIKETYDKIVVPFPINARSQIFPQYPPYSASVYWAKGMKERIEQDMNEFRSLDLVIEDKESVELLNDKYSELLEILESMRQDAYSEWKSAVEAEADGWLQENLFGDKDDGLLIVNFNHELYATLKEVQYMQLVGYDDIPATASKIFSEKEIFRKNLSFLDQIAHSYNKILRNANTSEREILKGKLKKIDDVLKEGKEQLTWSDSGSTIWKYVEKLSSPVADMLERFQNSQDNVAQIKKLVLHWITRPLYERKEGDGNFKLLCLDDHARQRKIQQYKEIEDASVKIHDLVAKNKELLHDNNTTENAWRSYVNYIDGIVKDAFIRTAAVSIGYLADHTDPTLTPAPLFEVVMELDDGGPNFTPAIEITQSSSFMNLIEDILVDIFRQGALVKRISPGKDDYMADMETAQNISEMHNDIIERVHQVLNQAKEYTQRFNAFSHIWEDDKKEYLGQFLKYGRQLTQEEIDAKFAGVEIPEKEPSIEHFQETIDRFEKLYQEVEKFEQETVFDKWFRLNMRSFRQSLLNNCKRWSFLFKQYLIDTVVGGLQDLDDFIQGAQIGLTQPLREGDTKTLISVMKWLQQMKERQVATDNMFEPIKKYIELMKLYDYEPPDTVFVQLEQLPQKWTKMKKLAIQVKHQAAPLQVKEVANIRKRIVDFDKTQLEFREKFKESEFFNKESANPYTSIDAAHAEIAKLEEEYDELCSQAELFEVIVPEPKSLRSCPRELRFAKNIWDCIFIVESCLEDWKATPWQAISVESIGAECARLRKDAKAVDIDLKQWDIFTTLESISKGIN